MTSSTLLLKVENGLATFTLNRPEKLNSLNTEVFEALAAAVANVRDSAASIGCVILRGAGRCFSAGHDLGAIGAGETSAHLRFQNLVIEQLANLPQPVITAVHGHCYTGALELALAGDIILAANSAKFADTHAKWGLSPVWGMSQRLPRRIGGAKAGEMMFTCRTVSGAEAAAIGLANACFEDDAFDGGVAEFASHILANSWYSNAANKRLLIETDGMSLSAGLAHETFRSAGTAPDMNERIARFSSRKG